MSIGQAARDFTSSCSISPIVECGIDNVHPGLPSTLEHPRCPSFTKQRTDHTLRVRPLALQVSSPSELTPPHLTGTAEAQPGV